MDNCVLALNSRLPVRLRRTLLAVGISLLTTSCTDSGSGGGNGDAARPPSRPAPTSAEEANKALPEEYRVLLETWKSSPFKTCDAAEVFGVFGNQHDRRASTKYLDMRQIAAMNGGTLVFNEGTGSKSFAILGYAERPTETQSTKSSFTRNETGATPVSVEAETNLAAGLCQLYLYGQLVYEADLAKKVQVTAGFSESVQPSKTAAMRPRVVAGPLSDEAALRDHGIMHALASALNPKPETIQMIARKLNLPETVVDDYVVVSPGFNNPISVEVTSSPGVLPFSFTESEILGKQGLLNSLMATSQPIALRVRFAPLFVESPRANVLGAISNPTVNISLKSEAVAGDPTSFTYQVTSANWMGTTAFSDSDASTCFRSRLKNLRDVEAARVPTGSGIETGPTVEDVKSPCSVVSPKLDELTYSDVALHEDILRHISNRVNIRLYGWDGVILAWVRRAIADGKDIKQSLDPKGLSPIVSRVADNARDLVTQLDRHANLRPLRLQFALMGAQWGINLKYVSYDLKQKIVDAAANTVDLLPTSLGSLLSRVSSDPENSSDVLAYAADMRTQEKDQVRELVHLAQEIGLTDFEATTLGSFLQNKTSQAEIQSWLTSLAAAKDFSTRDLARVTRNYAGAHERKKLKLIRHAVKEYWNAADFTSAEAIAPLLKEYASCGMSADQLTDVSQLIDCRHTDLFSKGEGQLLDNKYTDRYARLAQQLPPLLARYTNLNLHKKGQLVDAFFAPIWKACSNTVFAERSQQLVILIESFLNESDWAKANEKSRAVDEALRSGCQ